MPADGPPSDSRHRPSNHAADGWLGPDVVMDPDPTIEPPFNSHDVEVLDDGPDGHVWDCHTCDVAGWYDAGSDTGAHDDAE